MRLGDLILKLRQECALGRGALILRNGFSFPTSYRGYYEQVAFNPASNVSLRSMLGFALSADGKMFEGWKGGEFTMNGDTEAHIAEDGCYHGSDDALTTRWLDAEIELALSNQQEHSA